MKAALKVCALYFVLNVAMSLPTADETEGQFLRQRGLIEPMSDMKNYHLTPMISGRPVQDIPFLDPNLDHSSSTLERLQNNVNLQRDQLAGDSQREKLHAELNHHLHAISVQIKAQITPAWNYFVETLDEWKDDLMSNGAMTLMPWLISQVKRRLPFFRNSHHEHMNHEIEHHERDHHDHHDRDHDHDHDHRKKRSLDYLQNDYLINTAELSKAAYNEMKISPDFVEKNTVNKAHAVLVSATSDLRSPGLDRLPIVNPPQAIMNHQYNRLDKSLKYKTKNGKNSVARDQSAENPSAVLLEQ